jgi:hypothetical protein
VRRIALTGPLNQEMRRASVCFFGRSARLRLDGRLAIDLSLPCVKRPKVMQGGWDHYDQIGVIPAPCIDRPLNQTGCIFGS